jgi:hypothetical protein
VFSRASRPRALESQIIRHQPTRYRPRMCLLGVPSIHFILWWVNLQKSYIFGTSMGIFSLNVHRHVSTQKKQIIMLDGSKCVSRRQDIECAISKNRRWVISGVKLTFFPQNSFRWGFQAKTPCWIASKLFDWFSLTVHQPIQLNNMNNMKTSKLFQLSF